MSPALLTRVEDESGAGPFTADKLGYLVFSSLNMWTLPMPQQDNLQAVAGLHFAFQRPDLFEHWVSIRDRYTLRAQGFVQAWYLCPPGTVRFGEQQAVFERSEAICTQRELL